MILFLRNVIFIAKLPNSLCFCHRWNRVLIALYKIKNERQAEVGAATDAETETECHTYAYAKSAGIPRRVRLRGFGLRRILRLQQKDTL